MNAITDILHYADELIAAGVPDKQAKIHAEKLAQLIENNLATKEDIRATKEEIRAVEKRLDTKIDAVETKLEAKIGAVDTKINWLLGLFGTATFIFTLFNFIKPFLSS